MYKGVLVFLLFFLLVGSVSALTEIKDCQGLQDINKNIDEDYILANNIDCSETSKWNNGAGFLPIEDLSGVLDGKDYTISGLYMKNTYVGMFLDLCHGGTIKNLKFNSAIAIIEENQGEGGILLWGSCESTTNSFIDNIDIEGSIYGGINEYTGGLAGRISKHITVTNSHFSGYVGGAGGFVGQNDGTIINCSFDGIVNGTAVDIWYSGPNCFSSGFKDCIAGLTGGFAGWNFGTIESSYSKGTVEGLNNVGGFVGGDEYIDETWRGEIFDSYSTANVTGLDYKGGFVGYNVGGDLVNCYSTGAVKNSSASVPKSLESITPKKLYVEGYSLPATFKEEDGTSKTGGFLAYLDLNKSYECYDSFWDIETSGVTTSACAANGKTTSEMQNPETYATWNPDIWSISFRRYPCLSWEEGCGHGDSDNDGVPDIDDKCPNTSLNEEQLVYGCSCEQILELKPGKDTLENRKSCSKGMIDVVIKTIGWGKYIFVLPPYNPFISYFYKFF